jgi:molecular chaperone Hsp33
MSELHTFLFEGLPVRGMLVRITSPWQEILRRRAEHPDTGAYTPAVRDLLGEMTAAAVLMQGNIKFNGALVLQVFGDGPLKLAVVEVQSDLQLRATAKQMDTLPDDATFIDAESQRGRSLRHYPGSTGPTAGTATVSRCGAAVGR